MAACAVQARLNADTSDQTGPRVAGACGQPARSAGRRAKTFASVLGPLTLERAYYHCAACAAGCCPRDRALGLVDTSLSPGVLRMVGLVGAMVSLEEGHELLRELAGVRVPTTHVERAAEALGREIAHDERTVVEPPPAGEPVAPTLYLGLDGTGVPVRKDTDQMPGAFAARVAREATRRGFDRTARRVVLGDGAKWTWNLADEHLPEAVQIVDRFHVKQNLSDVAKSLYGAGSDLGAQWARARHDELDAGAIEAVLDARRVHAPTDEAARQCVDYVDGNRARMRYAAFRAAGLCTSTGVVEAGCKTVIGVRCTRAGMHWTVAGADAIIALRCCKLSGRFEDFWERRTPHRAA